jgi:D-glycero-D-manno-heptose 1,7-bisphosphate phosphatase
VINRGFTHGHYLRRWEEVELLPGVEDAIAQLNRSGRKVIVATNQRGVALGLCTEAELQQLHARLQQHLAAHGAHLDAIYYCPHDNGQCNCRKPLPGMFEQAFRNFSGASAANSVMIGDSLSDVETGRNVGIRTVFIAAPGQSPKPGAEQASAMATACSESLLDFVEQYLVCDRPA